MPPRASRNRERTRSHDPLPHALPSVACPTPHCSHNAAHTADMKEHITRFHRDHVFTTAALLPLDLAPCPFCNHIFTFRGIAAHMRSCHLRAEILPPDADIFTLCPRTQPLQAWLWENRTWHLGSITPCSREADSGLFLHFEGQGLVRDRPYPHFSFSNPAAQHDGAATFFIDDSPHRDAVVPVEPSQPTGHLPSLPPPSDPAPPSGLASTLPPPPDPGSPCPICMDEDDDRDARIPWACCSARICPPCSLRLRTGRNPACPFCRQRLEPPDSLACANCLAPLRDSDAVRISCDHARHRACSLSACSLCANDAQAVDFFFRERRPQPQVITGFICELCQTEIVEPETPLTLRCSGMPVHAGCADRGCGRQGCAQCTPAAAPDQPADADRRHRRERRFARFSYALDDSLFSQCMVCGDERNIYECLGCGDMLDPSQFYATPMTHLEMQTHVLATSDRPLFVAVMNRDVSHGGITRDGGAETWLPPPRQHRPLHQRPLVLQWCASRRPFRHAFILHRRQADHRQGD